MKVNQCSKRRSGAYVCFGIAVGLLILLLVGCATPEKETIEVPVPVACVKDRPERPDFRTDAEILELDDYRAVYALRAERKKAEKYIGKLEDVVDVCEHAPSVVVVEP